MTAAIRAGSLRAEGETARAAAVRLAVSLRRSYLPMQGPPGTGKTYTAAEQILELIAHGRTVGITGPSHAVICHLIDTVYEHARSRNAGVPRIGQRAERDNPHRHADATTMSNEQLEKALRDDKLDVAAGMAWIWACAGLAASVDIRGRRLRWSSTRWRPRRRTRRLAGWTSSTTRTG